MGKKARVSICRYTVRKHALSLHSVNLFFLKRETTFPYPFCGGKGTLGKGGWGPREPSLIIWMKLTHFRRQIMDGGMKLTQD